MYISRDPGPCPVCDAPHTICTAPLTDPNAPIVAGRITPATSVTVTTVAPAGPTPPDRTSTSSAPFTATTYRGPTQPHPNPPTAGG